MNCLLVALTLLMAAFPAKSERLFLLSKSGEISNNLIRQYEKESGKIVVSTLYDNESEKNLIMSKSGGFSYDVIVTKRSSLPKFFRSGVFAPNSFKYTITSEGKWAFLYEKNKFKRPNTWKEIFQICLSRDDSYLVLPNDARIIILGIMSSLNIRELNDKSFAYIVNNVIRKCNHGMSSIRHHVSEIRSGLAIIKYSNDFSGQIDENMNISFPETYSEWQYVAATTDKSRGEMASEFIDFLKKKMGMDGVYLNDEEDDFYDNPKNSKFESDFLSIIRASD